MKFLKILVVIIVLAFAVKAAKDSGWIDLANGLIKAHNISAESEKQRLASLTPEQRAQEHKSEMEKERTRIEADKQETQRRENLTSQERLREDEVKASREARKRAELAAMLDKISQADKEEADRRARLSPEERAREDALQKQFIDAVLKL